MSHPRGPVFLALLVVGFGVAVALGGGTPVAASGTSADATDGFRPALEPVTVGPNTTRILQLDTIGASGYSTPSVSVTDGLQADTSATAAKLDQYAVVNRIQNDTADSEQILQGAIDRLDTRIEALDERERRARNEFRTNRSGPADYLTAVGAVNREAVALEARLSRYDELAADQPYLQDRVSALLARTVKYTGPLAEEVGVAVNGGTRSGEIFVAVGDNGMVLSAIRDGTHTREITRTDARDDAIGGVDLGAAQDRIAELYPWAWGHKCDVSINTVSQDVFRFQLSHNHGVLRSLLDTSSGNVYREVQTKSLSSMPTTAGPRTTVDNRTLQVSDPVTGSPVRVRVVNESGVPVPATIKVDGMIVGVTDDSAVWLISPRDPFTVTATTSSETLEVDVHPE